MAAEEAGRLARARRAARRALPLALMAWRRWQALPDHKKEQYKRQARDYASRGKQALDRRRPGRS
jgi:hypothetical protein